VSESDIGEAMRGEEREKIFLATKLDVHDLSKDRITFALAGSLSRLRTDYIDLYQIHWPNPQVPLVETLFPLIDAYRQGIIRRIGLCNFGTTQLKLSNEILASCNCPSIASLQLEYSLNNRLVEERVIPYCETHNTAFIAYSPFDGGAFLRGPHPELEKLAKRYGVPVSSIVLAWMLRYPRVSAIPETHDMFNLTNNLNAHALRLSSEEVSLVNTLYTSSVISIPAAKIRVVLDGRDNRKVYTTLEEALENKLGLVPGPSDLAKEVLAGDILKPVKVRKSSVDGMYDLIEGRVRYWAYVIAFKDICMVPAVIVEK
jgi:diketogulonate reductase-like aldo/keto reductase